MTSVGLLFVTTSRDQRMTSRVWSVGVLRVSNILHVLTGIGGSVVAADDRTPLSPFPVVGEHCQH